MTEVQTWAFGLTLGGGAGEFIALAWGWTAAISGRRRISRRVAEFKAVKMRQEAGREARARRAPSDQTSGPEMAEVALDEELTRVLGRPQSDWNDVELIPEQAALAVLADQVRAIAGPAALLVLSVCASTVGALLSFD